ncbi:MAG: glycoside hydrolase family 2 TIM barrel-domain containing protein [Candidatus Pedobacter colombiensis]|uniref:Glycoside hydrolase family 2 TIM barrel-domain containing protein n=1 Tax=Candidatus Pedobacter colombiensis TaxID=3121371 RepID=A0AAJ5WD85_9SPHI|nr:sugar-binding domain-containing protein [Pedobacter sp.]WEK21385.1 MAG: glycoside hydrolase family 2 TIM barrel-domain containing protein [Pedobacter sp.]
MKRFTHLFICAMLLFTVAAAQKKEIAARTSSLINEGWTFSYVADEKAGEAFGNESHIAIPHTWSTYETTRQEHPFIRNPSPKDGDFWWKGWGWYKRNLQISKSQQSKRIIVEFDGVQKYCKVWLNGHLLGEHKGGFTSFYFDLTGFVQSGNNVLTVAVNNQQRDGFSIPPMDAGNWDLYGGIYRDVRLVVTDKLYVPFQGSATHEGGTFITTPVVSDQQGIVHIKTWIKNDFKQAKTCRLKTIITNPKNEIVAEVVTSKIIAPGTLVAIDQQSAPIKKPMLWSPSSPSIYKVHSVIQSEGKVSDIYQSTFGFRWFYWDYTKNRLILNGKELNIQGIMRHQEYPWLGDAIPKWMSRNDLLDIKKNLEMNFYRGTHYSQDPYVYDLCDSLGLMVCEDLPNVKNKPFSTEVQQQQLREMIRRDRNHPSILFWGMGDETDHAANSEWAVKEDTTRIIHARAVVGPSAGKYAVNTDQNVQFGGLLQCTIRGWYNKDVKDFEPESSQHAGNEEWQHARARIKNKVKADERIDMTNLIVWCYADHGCDREYRNSPLLHLNPKGWVDLYRVPKYVYYLYQANHAKKPMIFIHPHNWTARYLGSRRDIIVDSNCDQVRLISEGKDLGVLYPDSNNLQSVVFKNVSVNKGTLIALGYKKGLKVCDTLYMAGPPARLKLSTSHLKLQAAKNEIAILTADVVDAAGHHVIGANPQLHWKVDGPATLVGPDTFTTDTDKQAQMEGTMYIDVPVKNVIRSTGIPGKITVTLLSDGLEKDKIEILVVKKIKDDKEV